MLLRRLPAPARFAIAAAVAVAAAAARTPGSYKGAIATDAATGAVLFEDNADAVSPPASMTKLMTFAVLYDELKEGAIALDTPVMVTAEDAKVALLRNSTEVWLKQGEVFPVEELIYAMMIQSANDAAYTLAHKAGGTVAHVRGEDEREGARTRDGPQHVPLAARLPSPEPSDRRRRPDDAARLLGPLPLPPPPHGHPQVHLRQVAHLRRGHQAPPVLMTNHNHLLGQDPRGRRPEDGLHGRRRASAWRRRRMRDGHRIIVVMMDSPDSRTRDLNVQELINRGLHAASRWGEALRAAGAGSRRPEARGPRAGRPAPAPDGGPAILLPRAGPR